LFDQNLLQSVWFKNKRLSEQGLDEFHFIRAYQPNQRLHGGKRYYLPIPHQQPVNLIKIGLTKAAGRLF